MLHVLPDTIESRRTKVTLSHSTVLDRIVFQNPTGAKPPSADCLLCRSFRACVLAPNQEEQYIDRRHM